VHGNISAAIEAHQRSHRVGGVVERGRADVQGLLDDRPAAGFEDRADRLPGENLSTKRTTA
jgi:hypothetical protein